MKNTLCRTSTLKMSLLWDFSGLSSTAPYIEQDVLSKPINKNNNCLYVYIQLRLLQSCLHHAFCHLRQSQELRFAYIYLLLAK